MQHPLRLWMLFLLFCAAAAPLPASVRVLRDQPYGPHPRQRMDVYLPPHAHDAPVLFMVHGGAWRMGDKAHANVVHNKVARWVPQGVVLVSVNYRLLPEAAPLEQAINGVDDMLYVQSSSSSNGTSWSADTSPYAACLCSPLARCTGTYS